MERDANLVFSHAYRLKALVRCSLNREPSDILSALAIWTNAQCLDFGKKHNHSIIIYVQHLVYSCDKMDMFRPRLV